MRPSGHGHFVEILRGPGVGGTRLQQEHPKPARARETAVTSPSAPAPTTITSQSVPTPSARLLSAKYIPCVSQKAGTSGTKGNPAEHRNTLLGGRRAGG